MHLLTCMLLPQVVLLICTVSNTLGQRNSHYSADSITGRRKEDGSIPQDRTNHYVENEYVISNLKEEVRDLKHELENRKIIEDMDFSQTEKNMILQMKIKFPPASEDRFSARSHRWKDVDSFTKLEAQVDQLKIEVDNLKREKMRQQEETKRTSDGGGKGDGGAYEAEMRKEKEALEEGRRELEGERKKLEADRSVVEKDKKIKELKKEAEDLKKEIEKRKKALDAMKKADTAQLSNEEKEAFSQKLKDEQEEINNMELKHRQLKQSYEELEKKSKK